MQKLPAQVLEYPLPLPPPLPRQGVTATLTPVKPYVQTPKASTHLLPVWQVCTSVINCSCLPEAGAELGDECRGCRLTGDVCLGHQQECLA